MKSAFDTAAGRHPHIRWLYLALCSFGLLFIGIPNAWSILKVPLAESAGYTSEQLAVNYTLTLSFFCIGNLAAGWLWKKAGPRRLLAAGAILIVGGLSISSRLEGSAAKLFLFYGVMVGGGVGVAYNTFLSVTAAWFPDRRGISAGVSMMCFGLSTMLLGKLAVRLFDLPGFGWRYTYVGIGALTEVVLLLCAAILKTPSRDSAVLRAGDAANGGGSERHDFSTREMLRHSSFWVYYIYGIFASAVGSTVFSFAMDLSLSLGETKALATTVVGAMSIANGLGRVLCGLSFDSFGIKRTMLMANCVTIFAPALMLAALALGSVPLSTAALVLAGVSWGTCPTIGSALIGSFYGSTDFPMNYSISNSKLMFASLSASVANVLLNRSGGYTAPFMLLLGMGAVAFVLFFFIRRPRLSVPEG